MRRGPACALILAGLVLAGCALAQAAPTATLKPQATAAQAAAMPATATLTAQPATATATPTAQPATATATSVPATASVTATATGSPQATASPTRTVAVSSGSLTLDGQEITYSYPAGWRLKQETRDGYSRLTLDGPDGAVMSLLIYTSSAAPAQLAAVLLDAIKNQFPGVAATPLAGTVAGSRAEGYTLTFSYSGVAMTGTILSFRAARLGFTLYTQAADELASAAQPGFDVFRQTLTVK